MRPLLNSGIIFAVLLISAPSSGHAAWCAQYNNGGTNCGFSSHAQCQATVSGVGGFCSRTADELVRAVRRVKAPATNSNKATPSPAARAPATATSPQAARPVAISPPTAQPKPQKDRPDPRAFAAARKLVLAGQYEAGLAAMRKLGSDDYPDVASFIGLAYRKLGRNDEAKSWYDRALAADPKHLQTLAFDGVLRAEQGDIAGARVSLQKIKLICGNTTCNEYVGLSSVIAAKAQ